MSSDYNITPRGSGAQNSPFKKQNSKGLRVVTGNSKFRKYITKVGGRESEVSRWKVEFDKIRQEKLKGR